MILEVQMKTELNTDSVHVIVEAVTPREHSKTTRFYNETRNTGNSFSVQIKLKVVFLFALLHVPLHIAIKKTIFFWQITLILQF